MRPQRYSVVILTPRNRKVPLVSFNLSRLRTLTGRNALPKRYANSGMHHVQNSPTHNTFNTFRAPRSQHFRNSINRLRIFGTRLRVADEHSNVERFRWLIFNTGVDDIPAFDATAQSLGLRGREGRESFIVILTSQ